MATTTETPVNEISEKTVRDLAVENPRVIRVFETLGIDYCCGGKRTLGAACERAGVPLEQALELLRDACKNVPDESADPWNEVPLHAITAHVVSKHHAYVRQESPRIEALLSKVIGRHGELHPEVQQIEEVFVTMSQELSAHLRKEEQILFPYIEKMEATLSDGLPLPPAVFGTVTNPIANMVADHDDAGALLARIRELSRNFTPPADACPTYRGLYQSLAEFESDLHRHVHLENNILFPRATRMESAAAKV